MKLAKVAVQVLIAHVLVRAHDVSLEHRPERFDAVDVHTAMDVLFLQVLHRLVVVVLFEAFIRLVSSV